MAMECQPILYPLTHPQKSIWYTEKMYPNTSIGNIAGTIRLKGSIDYAALEKAFNIFLKKNDGIRMRITEVNGEPMQYVSDFQYYKPVFIDFSAKPIESLFQWDGEATQKPFKLINSDLFYFALIKTSDFDGGFFIKIHHLACDAWTISAAVNQILEAYSQILNGLEINQESNPSYIEYIASENEYKESERFIKDKEFWNDKFSTLPEFTTFKSHKSNSKTTNSKRKTFIVSSKLTSKIHTYCKENKISIFMFFLAGLSIYINRITSKEDLNFGTLVLNRSNAKEKNMAGMFISTIPVRIGINDSIDFKTFAQQISKEWMQLLRHQKYPYDLLIRDLRKTNNEIDNLYDIILSYQNARLNKDEHIPEFEGRWHAVDNQSNSLSIHIDDRENEGHLIINYDYLTELFHAKEIEFIHDHMIRLLWHAIDNPEKKVCNLDMVSESERHKILYEFNNTKTDYHKDKTVYELFEEQVLKTPTAVALTYEDQSMTYEELNNKVNQLASFLREKNVQPNDIVGIMTNRSFEMIIGIYSIIKAGGAYLPIDPNYPEDRIKYMLEDSKANILLTQMDLLDTVKFNGEIINLDDKEIYKGSCANLERLNNPEDLVYIIYTSGSTGNPKGVMVQHMSLTNIIVDLQRRFPIGSNDAYLLKTTYTFDVSAAEIFGWFFNGGKLSILPQGLEKDPRAILKYIEKYSITHINFVPSMFNMFLNGLSNLDVNILNKLKYLFVAGEAISKDIVKKLFDLTNSINFINLYGPTEATIYATGYDLKDLQNELNVPIGKPLSNYEIYIVDKNLNLVPIGIPGELCISGDGLSKGYLNRSDLTNDKFIDNPFCPGKKMYKTGDLAKWYAKGDIEYLGRIDNQVKIRGLRIELGEIENALLSYEKIKHVVVIDRTDKNGKKYLCAYYVSENDVSSFALSKHISKSLPNYMVPPYYIRLDKLPLTYSGKINRKELPEPKIKINRKYVEPKNEVEKKLAEVWSEVLNIEDISTDENFFDLGGDSLSIIQVQIKLFQFNWNLSIQDFYKYPTIKELSNKISSTSFDEETASSRHIIESFVPKNIVQKTTSHHKKDFKNILLTGATGFLGIHILNDLLSNTTTNIYCLVRGQNITQAQTRLMKLFNFYFNDKNVDLLNKRFFIITGDITLENFGLTNEEYVRIGKSIDTVIHASGLTKHYGHYSEFKKVNIDGTKRIIDFCLSNSVTLNHISTVSICGNYLTTKNSKKINFTENDFYIGQNYSDNVYIKSKYEAEDLIFKSISLGLNVHIFRVGILTGRYSDGHFQVNISENAFYNRIKSIIKLGVIPTELSVESLEFTPVDSCSAAIIKLIQNDKESKCRVYHLFNHKKINMNDLVNTINSADFSVELIDSGSFNQYIKQVSQDPKKQEFLRGIITDFDKHKSLNYNTDITIKSEITINALKKTNFEWPEINNEYILKILNYMQEIKFI
jgi:amino acid adenylation domain-containing protein/thioester reductase-like protein